jgi:hypothetical protein
MLKLPLKKTPQVDHCERAAADADLLCYSWAASVYSDVCNCYHDWELVLDVL